MKPTHVAVLGELLTIATQAPLTYADDTANHVKNSNEAQDTMDKAYIFRKALVEKVKLPETEAGTKSVLAACQKGPRAFYSALHAPHVEMYPEGWTGNYQYMAGADPLVFCKNELENLRYEKVHGPFSYLDKMNSGKK